MMGIGDADQRYPPVTLCALAQTIIGAESELPPCIQRLRRKQTRRIAKISSRLEAVRLGAFSRRAHPLGQSSGAFAHVANNFDNFVGREICLDPGHIQWRTRGTLRLQQEDLTIATLDADRTFTTGALEQAGEILTRF